MQLNSLKFVLEGLFLPQSHSYQSRISRKFCLYSKFVQFVGTPGLTETEIEIDNTGFLSAKAREIKVFVRGESDFTSNSIPGIGFESRDFPGPHKNPLKNRKNLKLIE